jgi:hypothetical protein
VVHFGGARGIAHRARAQPGFCVFFFVFIPASFGLAGLLSQGPSALASCALLVVITNVALFVTIVTDSVAKVYELRYGRATYAAITDQRCEPDGETSACTSKCRLSSIDDHRDLGWFSCRLPRVDGVTVNVRVDPAGWFTAAPARPAARAGATDIAFVVVPLLVAAVVVGAAVIGCGWQVARARRAEAGLET